MKRTETTLLLALLLLFSVACSKQSASPTWQEQYDLGIHYLSEGNYQEAIIAFTAAIEIDPKRAEAYDKLADAYLAAGDTEAAMDSLLRGCDATGDQSLRVRAEELEKTAATDTTPQLTPRLDSENEYNAYGATEFTKRPNYVSFEDYSVEEQQFIKNVVNSAMAQDVEGLQSLLGFDLGDPQYMWRCTMWNDYKIKIHASARLGNYNFEVRTQNGMGCAGRVSFGKLDSGAVTSYTQLSICPCVDWQWNGQMIQHNTETADYGVIQREITGKLVNNLRIGTFVENSSGVFDGRERIWTRTTEYTDGLEMWEEEIAYENGVESHWRQERPESTILNSIYMGISTDRDEQSIKDFLYW